jgi:4,5-DOPA dioxygenase extradiol
MSVTLPTLFVSHGAPTWALEPGLAGARLAGLATRLPRPRALLVVSAHWETDRPSVSGARAPQTLHDFFGFPRELHSLRYAAAGAPELAERVAKCLGEAGMPTRVERQRGLDHGAWVPLMHLFPAADIPVTQLSLMTSGGPERHWRMGRALTSLRDEGVLIIGSGSITHNLREFRRVPEDSAEEPYVTEFRDWMAARIDACDHEAMLAYRVRAPHAVRAHPTEEHLLPLFVALGAAEEARQRERLHSGVTYGVIGMDSYLFAAPPAETAA